MASFQGTKINPSSFHKSQIKFIVVLVPVSIFMILPIIYIFSTAFKPIEELFAYPPPFIVKHPTVMNFKFLFSDVKVFRALFNSFAITFVVMLCSIVASSMAAYALSKMEFGLKKILFEINTLALMFVGTAVVIPRYMVISNLGIINTFLGHILPMISMPVGLFLVKQFVDQIPDSLVEAGKIDGAGDFRIFFSLIIPMIKPALATIAILSFQAAWSSDETSKYFINDENLKNFAFYITSLTNAGNAVVGQGMAAAGTLIMFLPNFIIFICMQSKVMNTMAHSGIK